MELVHVHWLLFAFLFTNIASSYCFYNELIKMQVSYALRAKKCSNVVESLIMIAD